MEDFIPGLVKVMEERLGTSGRPITTIFVVLVVVGVSAWMIGLVNSNIVGPASRTLKPVFQGRPINAIDGLVPLGISVLVAILALILMWMLNKKVRELSFRSIAAGRVASRAYDKTEELEAQIQKARQELTNKSQTTDQRTMAVLDIIGRVLKMIEDDHVIRDGMETRISRLEK